MSIFKLSSFKLGFGCVAALFGAEDINTAGTVILLCVCEGEVRVFVDVVTPDGGGPVLLTVCTRFCTCLDVL